MSEAVWKTVDVGRRGAVIVVTIFRPDRRNAVDAATAAALLSAFTAFEEDDSASVAVLTGAGGTFCSGADLKALAEGDPRPVTEEGPGPMGPTRLELAKPVIAAIEGHAVAGGLELALWCDLRVAASDAVLGVYCRRFGVPLVDGGTVRLPRLVGQSRALDLILTGRGVDGAEALAMGLVNRVAPPGQALDVALELAREIAAFPQTCLRNDRRSALWQWTLPEPDALVLEARFGRDTIASGETGEGAARFAAGAGRHGTPLSAPPAAAPEAPGPDGPALPLVGAPTVASRVSPAVTDPAAAPRGPDATTPPAVPAAGPPSPSPGPAAVATPPAPTPPSPLPDAPGPASAEEAPAPTAPTPDARAGARRPAQPSPPVPADRVPAAVSGEPDGAGDRPPDAPRPGPDRRVFVPMEAAPDPKEPAP